MLVLFQSIYYICTIAESYYEWIFALKLQLQNDFQAKSVQYISLGRPTRSAKWAQS